MIVPRKILRAAMVYAETKLRENDEIKPAWEPDVTVIAHIEEEYGEFVEALLAYEQDDTEHNREEVLRELGDAIATLIILADVFVGVCAHDGRGRDA